MWRDTGAKRKKKKPSSLYSFCFAATFAHELCENEEPLGKESCKFPEKRAAVYPSRPLTSKVFQRKGLESRRHRGHIKRWQRWRPSTGPFTVRRMEASNTETHEAFSRLAPASGPPPIRRLAERTISGAFVKFDKVLLLFVCLESSLLFCLFFAFFPCHLYSIVSSVGE